MRITYLGDGRWAARCLEALVAKGHDVALVVTRARPTDESLAAAAQLLGIRTMSYDRINAEPALDELRSYKPELLVSMSYDQILRPPLLQLAALGAINCHAGRLPFYRGRNVLNWALVNGETEIGLTVHYMDEGIDTGDILVQETLPVAWEDDYASLMLKVTDAFPPLLIRAVGEIESGTVAPRVQRHERGTYFAARKPGDEWIDWTNSSINIYNLIRAITRPGPGARTSLDGCELSVWRAVYDPSWPRYLATPGEVVAIDDEGIIVKTGDSTIILTEISPGATAGPRLRVGHRFRTPCRCRACEEAPT